MSDRLGLTEISRTTDFQSGLFVPIVNKLNY